MSGRGETDVAGVTRVPEMSEPGADVEEGAARMTVRRGSPDAEPETRETIIEARDVSVYYGAFRAVRDISIAIARNDITALIGPSGCGKTTFLRCLNRMNDLIEGELVEESLQRAALWDEVKSKLRDSAMALSGGQQQRLCIARAIATKPDVILMDEPCSALDPIATQRIEDLMQELVSDYTIVIVTHNMQQAARVSDRTAFFTVEVDQKTGQRTGRIVEYDKTETIFTNPSDKRTEDYVTGRFG